MSRPGKIERLPRAIREEINRRLDEGAIGPHVAAWANELPEVQAVVAEHFGGRGITAQNMSDWRQGWYQDWCRAQEAVDIAARMGDSVRDVAELGAISLHERMETAMLLAMMVRLRNAEAMEEGPDKHTAVLEVVRSYERFQRSQHDRERAAREKYWDAHKVDRTREEEAEAKAERDFRGSELLKKHWWDVGRHFKTVRELKEGQHRPLPPDVLAFFLEEAAFEVRNDQALRRIALGRSWKSRGFQPFDEWDRPEEKAAAAAAVAAERAAAELAAKAAAEASLSAPVAVAASPGAEATAAAQPATAADAMGPTPAAAATTATNPTPPVETAGAATVPAAGAGASTETPAEIAANPAKSCQIELNVDRSQPPPEQLYEWGRGGFRKVGEADAA